MWSQSGDEVFLDDADLAFHDALLRAARDELLSQMSVVIEVGALPTEPVDQHAEVLAR